MKKWFFLVTILIGISCFGQTTSDDNWYKHLQGTIATYPVTMHLHKSGHTYSGYYYYNKSGQLISISGEDTTKKGTISLFAFTPGHDESEDFTFKIQKGNAKGTWQKNDKNSSLPFTADEAKGDSVLPFDYMAVEGFVRLKPNMATSPQATFEWATIWPDHSGHAPFIKEIISTILGEKAVPATISSVLFNRKQAFITGYLEQNKNVTEKEIAEMAPVYSQDETNKVLVAFQSPRLLTLAHQTYTYSGGAHGLYGTEYKVLDLMHNKPLQLNDMVNEKGRSALAGLLATYFRKNYGLKATEPLTEGGLFKNTIQPNDNFYLTQKGIGFSYQPYEIGPYALGQVEVFIPFTELKMYLQPGFAELLD